jgi:hypothetical protein
MRITANITYKQQEAQDALRISGSIPFILSMMKLDDGNPGELSFAVRINPIKHEQQLTLSRDWRC